MKFKVRDIQKILEELAPITLAESWDNVGLLVGDENAHVNRVLVCLDVTREVANEAILKKVDMIVSHHPLIFNSIKNLRVNEHSNDVIYELIKNEISVYCAHTNLDKAEFGTDFVLARELGLLAMKPLSLTDTVESFYKVVVFVPHAQLDKVFENMSKNGAGQIGNYSNCSFRISGTGTYLPLENSNPYIGDRGKLAKEEEVRLEMLVKTSELSNVIEGMIFVHPYDQVAYDVIPLKNEPIKLGFGRVGSLEEKTSLSIYLQKIKDVLGVSHLRLIGDLKKPIERVAVCAGSGADIICDNLNCDIDLYITGEIKYHKAVELLERNICVVEAGHLATEMPIVRDLTKRLQNHSTKLKYDLDVLMPEKARDPYLTI